MLLRLSLLLAGLAVQSWTGHAMFAEDAGSMDFMVATTGHGVTRFVHSNPTLGSVLTSDASAREHTTSCFVASRSIETGEILWRRNVCASPTTSNNSDGPVHVLTVLGDLLYTMDDTSIVRAWDVEGGGLVWDTPTAKTDQPRLWTFTIKRTPYVVAASSLDELTILNGLTGHLVGQITATEALKHCNVRPIEGDMGLWLSVLPASGDGNGFRAAIASVKPPHMSAFVERTALLDVQITDEEKLVMTNSEKLGDGVNRQYSANSLQVVEAANQWHGLALSSTGESLIDIPLTGGAHVSEFAGNSMHPSWSTFTSIAPDGENPNMIRLAGTDGQKESTGLYRFDGKTVVGWEQLYGLNDSPVTEYNGIAYCPKAELVVALVGDGLRLWRQDTLVDNADKVDSESPEEKHRRLSPLHAMDFSGDQFVPDGDTVEAFSVVACSSNKMSILVATTSGTTTQLTFSVLGDHFDVRVRWTNEEGLAAISSAVILDGSHLGADDLVEEQAVVLNKLALSSRLFSQWQSIAGLFSNVQRNTAFGRRDHVFGFVKIAALLSQSSHRIWGMNTSGDDRGSIRWSLDLPKSADWHTMVHGTVNSPKAIHGINGGTHSREILVLSVSPNRADWTCVDGTNGDVHSSGYVDLEGPVVQVLPLYNHGTGLCRQTSLLLHPDRSLSVVPNDAASTDFVKHQLTTTPNGLYAHFVDKKESKLESLRIMAAGEGSSKNSFESLPMGQAKFAGESIVKVVYPVRDEVVQSMCTVLGDDSLLLKYINPHVAVVVTKSNDGKLGRLGSIASALAKKRAPKKRKPAGVGDSASMSAADASDDMPNMFLNVVDTVSGRVLYRASHVNVDPKGPISAVISENWIVYSFVNQKTRRAELGVLTLHEGMIHSKGLTAFTSPEQTLSFSSFEARESKPVVLAKTYTFPKTITALGATATRGGISNRKIIVASADGRVTAIERKMLETRRPTGEIKEVEKNEGLYQYNELIPEVPLMAVSYNLTVEAATSIVASPTSLESQSLLFAFGGPDLFFARTSPSRGFDLLPDSFSRVLVSIVVLGLLAVLVVVNRMASGKNLKQGWL